MKEGASLPASEVLFASAVFSEDSGFFVAVPAKGAALVNRMQCIREHDRARDRQTERNRALAKSGKRRSFILAGQSGFGNPSDHLGELSIVHASVLTQKFADKIELWFQGFAQGFWSRQTVLDYRW